MLAIYRMVETIARPLGRCIDYVRQVYAPLADLRITILALALGGFLILGLEQGKDIIRTLADSANATDFSPTRENLFVFLRWALFLAACVWTGINAWYWSHLLYKIEPGSKESEPRWFTWLRRLLGVAPLLFAIAAMPLSARHGIADTWAAIAMFAAVAALLLWFFASRVSIADRGATELVRKLNEPVETNMPLAKSGRLVRGDTWFVLGTLAVSFAIFFLLLTPVVRTHFSWMVGPAALTFGAIGCIIPITSLLIYATRRSKIPIILVGICAFALFSLLNDNHAIRRLDAAVPERPTVAQALAAWEAKHPNPDDPIVLVASAGGASRAAYWTATVFRALENRTDGRFFDNVFAISSVSGGTLGAIGYAAWLSERPVRSDAAAAPSREALRQQSDNRLTFVQSFFGEDYLSPSIAGLLYPDLVQRFLPVPLFDDRAVSLEEAFELGWDGAVSDCKGCEAKAGRLAEEFTRIWDRSALKDPQRDWVPVVLANGTHVETGKRVITAPVRIDSGIFEDAYDFYDLSEHPIRASTAVMNSARFTVVSPPGRLATTWSRSKGNIIDGGYFENGALETLYDLARFIRRSDTSANRKIIIVEILNDDTANAQDLKRHDDESDTLAVEPAKLQWRSPFLSEIISVVGGLYRTRTARGTMIAKRLSDPVDVGLGETQFFSFALRPYGAERWHTAMSWTLSLGSLDAMDVRFGVLPDDVPKFLEKRRYLDRALQGQIANLRGVIAESRLEQETLERVLEAAKVVSRAPEAAYVGQAAKRK